MRVVIARTRCCCARGSPGDVRGRNFEKFLDSPHRVIVETDPVLVVGFDTAKFAAFTAEAIAAGLGVA